MVFTSDEEFNELEDLITALEPVKIGTEALCRRGATLTSADEVTKFIYQQLNMQAFSFSKELSARAGRLIGILHYRLTIKFRKINFRLILEKMCL